MSLKKNCYLMLLTFLFPHRLLTNSWQIQDSLCGKSSEHVHSYSPRCMGSLHRSHLFRHTRHRAHSPHRSPMHVLCHLGVQNRHNYECQQQLLANYLLCQYKSTKSSLTFCYLLQFLKKINIKKLYIIVPKKNKY